MCFKCFSKYQWENNIFQNITLLISRLVICSNLCCLCLSKLPSKNNQLYMYTWCNTSNNCPRNFVTKLSVKNLSNIHYYFKPESSQTKRKPLKILKSSLRFMNTNSSISKLTKLTTREIPNDVYNATVGIHGDLRNLNNHRKRDISFL